MLTTFWSVKGGSGTTVVAAGHALQLAARRRPTLLLDLSGDLPAALGIGTDGPGIADWYETEGELPPDALDRLAVEIAPRLRLLPLGRTFAPGGETDRGDAVHRPACERADLLVDLLATTNGEVVVDAGTAPGRFARRVASRSDRSVLVTRACYLALRRFHDFGLRPTDIVLVREPGRSLTAADVGSATGARVVAEIPVDRSIARTIDAGLLHRRLPRALVRPLWPTEAA